MNSVFFIKFNPVTATFVNKIVVKYGILLLIALLLIEKLSEIRFNTTSCVDDQLNFFFFNEIYGMWTSIINFFTTCAQIPNIFKKFAVPLVATIL